MSEIEAVSEAIAESAKFGTTSVKFTEKMLDFISKILGNPIEEAAGIIGDKLQYIRWQRQVRMVDEVNKILVDKGLDKTRTIPPKFALPMLEQASLEEDNYLQDIWCKLIANSLDPNFDSEIRYAFIEIIKSLTSLDAKILKSVYGEVSNKSDSTITQMSKISLDVETINRYLDASEDELDISFNNLMRVQCLRNPSLENSIFVSEQGEFVFTKNGKMHVALTSLGIVFIKICIE